jgi:hypothetical protein
MAQLQLQPQQPQQAQLATQHLFASANTQLALTLAQAERALHSQLQTQLEQELRRLVTARTVRSADQREQQQREREHATVTPALGTWQDGAEPSAHLVWVNAREWDALEVAEEVARQFKQQSVLVFSEQRTGSDVLYEIRSRYMRRDALNAALAPVGFRTVEDVSGILQTGSRAWIAGTREQAGTIAQLAREHGWDVETHSGTVTMVSGSGKAMGWMTP